MTDETIQAVLRLFKGVLIKDLNNIESEETQKQIAERCISAGILFEGYGVAIPKEALEEAIKMYGIDKEKWNQTFHKSFATVRDTDIVTLITQQIIHYFTTY